MPDPSTAGQKVVISGVLSGSSPGGAQVALWRKLAGQSSFQQFAITTTDSAGNYTFTLHHVMADQSWYVTSEGMQSSTLVQQVRAVIALASSTRTARVGQPVVLHGHVTPFHAGQTVLVERKHGGAWQVIARPRLSRGSNYTVSRRFGQPGAVRLRVLLPGDARNVQSASSTLTLPVKS
jgi:hypothetical protein